jgi:hypothetical protein
MKLYPRNDLAARRVLTEIRKLTKKKSGLGETSVLIEMYVNCREQGFALASCDARKVAFAEYRNSDDIIVYFGKRKDFEFNTNIASDRVYEKATFYRRGAAGTREAAKDIVKYLTHGTKSCARRVI